MSKHSKHMWVVDVIEDGSASIEVDGRFVLRVLRHQLAAHGKVEDGLAQALDLVGARGEGGQRVEGEAGVRLEGFGIGRVESGEARRCQPVA